MKRALVALLVAGVFVAGATAAGAATPLERKVSALQRATSALQRQNATLRRQLNALRRQHTTTRQIALEGAVVAYCDAAITADAFQTTWQVINAVGNKSVTLPAIQPLDDEGICGLISVARQQSLVPPTIAPFDTLLRRLSARPVLPFFDLWYWDAA